jgi:arginase
VKLTLEKVTLLGLPIHSLAKYRGMGMAVEAFRSNGIANVVRSAAVDFNDLGDAALSHIEIDSGPPNMRNLPQFLEDTMKVQDLASRVDPQDFVFCLGGECTFVVGTLTGFKSKFKGKPGMLWMDAHGDFNTPETTVSGFIGGMPLALACGRGPKLTQGVENARPLLDEANVVHLGSRSLDPLESKAMSSSPMKLYSASTVRGQGISRVAEEAAEYLAERCDWITCHFDVDLLDPSVMPAVNFQESGGFTFAEAQTVIEAVKRTGKLKVLDLTAYNPLLDRDGASIAQLLKFISETFRPHA